MDDASFQSAYKQMAGQEPEWTTWKTRGAEKKRCIDYIWISKELQAVEVLNLPSDDDVPPPRLPSLTFPSDHVQLMAKIEWKGEGNCNPVSI